MTQHSARVHRRADKDSRSPAIVVSRSGAATATIERPGFIHGRITARASSGRPAGSVTGLAELSFHPGGMICRRRFHPWGSDDPSPDRPRCGRGRISGFSRDSRQRLKHILMQLDCDEPAYFVTLTYHETWGEPADWKGHLRAFRARLHRRYGLDVYAGLWRLEQQQRGAPHFHLVVFCRRPLQLRELRQWVSRAWWEVTGCTSPEHLRAGTNVRRRQLHGRAGFRRLMVYLGKYMAKGADPRWIDRITGEVLSPGRIWGRWGDLPVRELGRVEVMHHQDYARIVDLVRRRGGPHSYYLNRAVVHGPGFSVWDDGQELLDRVAELVPTAAAIGDPPRTPGALFLPSASRRPSASGTLHRCASRPPARGVIDWPTLALVPGCLALLLVSAAPSRPTTSAGEPMLEVDPCRPAPS